MSTRWRWSPRRKISPAACPTLMASSGLITPLARPRMPSVPKYLRPMMSPARGDPRGTRPHRAHMADNRHHIGNCFKKYEQSLRAGLQWLILINFNGLGSAYSAFLPADFLSCREGGGWVTLTGSDPGNESSRPWSSARSRRRWVSSLGLFSSRGGFCFGLSMGSLPAAHHAPQ